MMTLNFDLQRTLNLCLLILAVIGGLLTGLLAGQLIDLSLGGEDQPLPLGDLRRAPQQQLSEGDFQVILERSLFNAQTVGQQGRIDLSAAPVSAASQAAAAPLGDLALIGTIVAGDQSLALISVGRKAGVYRLGAELTAGVVVSEIQRHLVVLTDRGVRRELPLLARKEPQAQLVRPAGQELERGILALGENRWQISQDAADNARGNLSTLLQSARMIPQLQDGQTVGFRLVEMEQGSLLEQVGLRVGDLLVEINGVPLNSPEKALQIFQQVREASNIALGLVRNGQRETFEYAFE